MFDAKVYPGIVELLTFLRSREVTLAVATSKVEPFAVPIVERIGLRDSSSRSAGMSSTRRAIRRHWSSARCCADSATPIRRRC